ncbi:hypothetical protein [Gilliamella sp. BG7]|uniref:hypothetical protein n=1 Tax=unclassified Gilliamella TaxID=2685620 RepID=UPI003988907E
MENRLNHIVGQLGEGLADKLLGGLSDVSHNRSTLTVDKFGLPMSVLHVERKALLNQP